MPESKAQRAVKLLVKEYPAARIALNFTNPLELLIATILSAQCTDKRVNTVTEFLFKKYRTVTDYANALPVGLQQEIKSAGLYRNKTKNIIAAARKIKKEFGGKVPSSISELIELPGVARKTANVVLFNAFGRIEGVAVDTHVKRLS